MNRREFLEGLGIGTLMAHQLAGQVPGAGPELVCDLAVIGGGVGGVAAALAALRNGLRVVMTEETGWVGGQLTQQAVPPDEHAWIEQQGATRAYREFRASVRQHYRDWFPLTAAGMRDPTLNPGNCGVSRICHEPRVALAVLESMLAPYLSKGQLTLLLNHHPVQAEVTGDRIRAVLVVEEGSGHRRWVAAPLFVDATELGDLLPLSGTEYVTGAESQSMTGEPHAPSEAQPLNMQAITWCFAMSYTPGADFTGDPPEGYSFWRDYVPILAPSWPGKLFSWTYTHPITLEPITRGFDPRPGAEEPGFWHYRRLADPANFNVAWPGTTLVNWPQNDYLLGNVLEVPADEAARNQAKAMELSLCLAYWLQKEAPRPDGGAGWPGLRLRGDLTGTKHGLAMRPYIREARRIKAEFTVLEQHVGTEARMEATGLARDSVTAESFPDSVGVGSYRIDLHPSTGGDNYIDISSLPFEIPLGSLIPVRTENLLPAAKNIGTTHITNGCYRLHPVEWNIGESVGALASFCKRRGVLPRRVRQEAPLLVEFQRELEQQGVEIRWADPRRSPR